MRTVLLVGPPGSGKTTTLTALANALEADGVRHAAIEAEALARVHPWPDDDAALEHLRHLGRSFERRGYPLLLVAATVTEALSLDRLRAALPAPPLVVRLAAEPDLLVRRIVAREPAGWTGLERLVEATPGLAAASARQEDVDLVLRTDVLGVADAVATIRAALTPPGPPRSPTPRPTGS